ncbi:type II secretion system F family protein, partial [Vibrio sp. 811]|nr:type II secretion system F family protein [Vibrio sp. 811]
METFIVAFGESGKKDLEQKLLNAGYYNKQLAKYYFPFKAFLFVVASLVIFFIDVAINSKIILLLIAAVTIIVLPDFLLELRRRWLVRKISKNLPYVLDIMSVCVQTGMTIEASFAYLAKELK